MGRKTFSVLPAVLIAVLIGLSIVAIEEDPFIIEDVTLDTLTVHDSSLTLQNQPDELSMFIHATSICPEASPADVDSTSSTIYFYRSSSSDHLLLSAVVHALWDHALVVQATCFDRQWFNFRLPTE